MEWLPWFNQAIRQTLRGFNSLWQRRVTHISRGELVAAKNGGGGWLLQPDRLHILNCLCLLGVVFFKCTHA